MNSNCLIESLRSKLKNPCNVTIYKRGSWWEVFRGNFPHFYWECGGIYYHFCAKTKNLTWYKQLWFTGKIDFFHWHNK